MGGLVTIRVREIWLLGLFAAAGGTTPSLVAAQDSTKAAPIVTARQPGDTTVPKPPISPTGALLRSFLLPGWGQARLDRKLTGGIFIAWEGVTLGMTLKTSHELNYLRRTNSGRIGAKKQEKQDWLILLAFNHLMAGLEAYVSAHLWDFPSDIKIRAVPGGVGGAFTLPPIR
jgi:hypothetical protein